MKLLMLFIILNIVNVILQTVKSIATIKCGKTVAAFVNAITYGLYTIVIVYTNCELNLWVKVAVVGIANLIGVYVVKYFEEKARRDKIWKIEATLHRENANDFISEVKAVNIPLNYVETEKYIIANCYCNTQTDSEKIKPILDKYKVKYFVSETKTL